MADIGLSNLGFGEMCGSSQNLESSNHVHGSKPTRADVIAPDDAGVPRADVTPAVHGADVVSRRADVTSKGDDVMADVSKSNNQSERVSVWERIDPKIVKTDAQSKSFASVVGSVPKPELEFFPVKEEVDARVHIPIKLTQGMANTYRSVLLGYFLGPRFPFPVVLRAVQHAWGKFGFIDATVNDHGNFFFRFNGQGGCLQVVESSPLMIKGVPLFVTQWDPSKGLHKPIHTSCPLWVKLYNVPLVAFNKEGISRIASAIGVPLRMDACTASTCDKLRGRNNFAKVLVNVWAKGVLKRDIEVVIPRLAGEGEDVVKVVVEYDWEPSQCSTCKIFGHTSASCAKRVTMKEDVRPKDLDRDGFQQPKRKFWRPKARKEASGVHQAETSKVKGTVSSVDTLVGVGSIKQVQVEPKVAPVVQTKEQVSGSRKITKDGSGDDGKQKGSSLQ